MGNKIHAVVLWVLGSYSIFINDAHWIQAFGLVAICLGLVLAIGQIIEENK